MTREMIKVGDEVLILMYPDGKRRLPKAIGKGRIKYIHLDEKGLQYCLVVDEKGVPYGGLYDGQRNAEDVFFRTLEHQKDITEGNIRKFGKTIDEYKIKLEKTEREIKGLTIYYEELKKRLSEYEALFKWFKQKNYLNR